MHNPEPFDLIVTLGPSLQISEKLLNIADSGPVIFRINGAHSASDQIQAIVRSVRDVLPSARIMIDLPGNKIRTSRLDIPIRLITGDSIELTPEQINFADFHKFLNVGDMVHANDNLYHLEVTSLKNGTIRLLSHSDGMLQSNKGLHVNGIHAEIPFLFKRDIDLIEAGALVGVDFISLSFVRNAADVALALEKIAATGSKKIQVFTKIETESALRNLDEILKLGTYFNIDRGDLSTDIGFLKLAAAIDVVVKAARLKGKRIFLATQFLKNMEQHATPLLSEVVDLHRSMRAGIHGIQLSEETAIGRYPVECVKFVFDMLGEIRTEKS